jgi:hypothetical protein
MSKKQPQLIAYCVKNREGQSAIWTKVGAAWAHAGKPGFSIELDALPVDGRLVLIEPKEAGSEAGTGRE